MTNQKRISDDDLVLEFCDIFRASGSLRSAVIAVANLAKRKRRLISLVFPPAVVETARYFGVTADDILGDSRASDIADKRHVAMWVARNLGQSLPKLGRAFDRDASTVRYACLRVERSPELRAAGDEILARVQASTRRLVEALDRRAA
jgi:chromosomal replication initiation ATPase DnaA